MGDASVVVQTSRQDVLVTLTSHKPKMLVKCETVENIATNDVKETVWPYSEKSIPTSPLTVYWDLLFD